jgi:hypothetical protein
LRANESCGASVQEINNCRQRPLRNATYHRRGSYVPIPYRAGSHTSTVTPIDGS